MPALTDPRHERYAVLLAEGKLSDEDAHVEAGYKRNRGNASRLKANENIQARIAEIRQLMAFKFDVTIEKVVEEMAHVAFANMGDYVDVDEAGNVKLNFEKVKAGDLRAVTKLRQKHIKGDDGETVIETQFELGSKTTGLDQLAKWLQMYVSKSEITVNHIDDKAETLAAARARARSNMNGSFKH